MDMWIKINSSGNILTHGNGTNKFIISTDDKGLVTVEIGGNKYTSVNSIPKDQWVFLTIAYRNNDSSGSLTSVITGSSGEVTLFNNMTVAAYPGYGRLRIGENLIGAIHELSLWDKYRSFAEASISMNTAKKSGTANLTGYWRMDEGSGNLAKDIARNRHMIVPTPNSWYIGSENYAANFSGNEYVSLNISTVPISSTDDYALELWFKAEPNDNVSTLFSVNENDLSAIFNEAGHIELIKIGRASCRERVCQYV